MQLRLSKKIALSRLYSRRKAEDIIKNGCVTVNNTVITEPYFLVSPTDKIKIKGKILTIIEKKPQIWLFHKPKGYLTTKNDPKNRPTVYTLLPKKLQNLLYVGRLDFNSEGLLLFTNNGMLNNYLTTAKNNIIRIYKVKTFGKITQEELNTLNNGITINGISYSKIDAKIIKQTNLQTWISFSLTEGKNNEIRNICSHFNLQVSRLIRTNFGPFSLSTLPKSDIKEVSAFYIKNKFKNLF